MIAQVLDRVIAFGARDEAEVVRAREEWAEAAGRVFDDDPLYEERAAAFLEWFVLERHTRGGPIPAQRFLVEETVEDLEGRWVEALLGSHRSLFEVRELRDGALLLDDLLGGGAFLVTERRRLPGVVEGDLFEARLVANVVSPPELLFTRSFQFHPREAAAELRRQGARALEEGVARAETLFRVARLRLKAARYGHVDAARIYAGDDKM